MSNVHMSPPPLSAQAMADLLCTLLVRCSGVRENGKPFWAYLCIKPSMAASFKEARESDNFVLEDYGTVIEWGEGAEIPADVQRRMKEQYGADPGYEGKLLDAIEAYKAANA